MMYGIVEYAQPLRAIGQALETLNVQTFELERAGETYWIRGAATVERFGSNHARAPASEKLRSIWGGMADQKSMLSSVPTDEECHGNFPDRPQLHSKGCRTAGNRKAGRNVMNRPRCCDPSSLSQLLRCIGAYLTQKLARLLKLTWAGNSLSVEYETSLGKSNAGNPCHL